MITPTGVARLFSTANDAGGTGFLHSPDLTRPTMTTTPSKTRIHPIQNSGLSKVVFIA